MSLFLCSPVLLVAGIAIGNGLPPAVGFSVTGALIVLVFGYVMRLTLKTLRKKRTDPEHHAAIQAAAAARRELIRSRSRQRARRPWRARIPADWVGQWVLPFLFVAVAAFTIWSFAEDVPGRAYDRAPICAPSQYNASCRATLALTFEGRRTPTQGVTVEMAFSNPETGATMWATFDQATVVEAARNAVAGVTRLRVETWRGGIRKVYIGGVSYWTTGEPRFGTPVTICLGLTSGSLLLITRKRLLRTLPPATRRDRQRRIENVGLPIVLAAGVTLLWEGRPWALVLLFGAAAWATWCHWTFRAKR
jgi:hypothetical protein